MTPFQIILHPTDFSPQAEGAFRLACSLARDHGGRVLMLHVMERPLIIYPGVMMPPPPPEPAEEMRQAVRDKLLAIESPEPAVPIERLLVEGDPATAILQIARERQCDLIVMGTHGRTGLSRLLTGSVAEKVLRKAPCPVATVKALPVTAAAPAAADTMEPASMAKV